MIANTERGEIPIKAGKKLYIFRLGLTGLAKLETLLSMPTKRFKLKDVMETLATFLSGDLSLQDLLLVMLAGLQEFHSDEIRTTQDVENLIHAAGGLDAVQRQLNNALALSLTPDPEDLEAARPQTAQAVGTR